MGKIIRRLLFAPFEYFGRLEEKLDEIRDQGTRIMGQLEDLVTQIDGATNAVAARLDNLQAELRDAIANGQPPKQETLTALANISTRLKSLGQDPTNPVPSDGGATGPTGDAGATGTDQTATPDNVGRSKR